MKKSFNLGEHSTLAAVIVFGVVLGLVLLFSSCKKEEDNVTSYRSNVQQVHDTVHVHDQGGSASGWSVREDANWTHVHAENTDGEVADIMIPTPSGVILPVHDTIEGTPNVVHSSYVLTSTDSLLYDTLSGKVHLVRYTEKYRDTYNQYVFSEIPMYYTEGEAELLGLTIPFPKANASLEWKTINTSEAGSDGTWDYTLATSAYDFKVNGGITNVKAYKTLKREAGHDVLVDSSVVNQGWQPLTYGQYGWPATALSWIEVVYEYSQSGQTSPMRKEATLTYGCAAPADTTVIAADFNLNWANPQAGSVVTTGTNTVNGITITSKKQNYAVGATGLFTRRFVFTWQTAKYGVFDMPSPAFTDYSETHTLTAISPVTGYDRMLAVNTAHAKVNSIQGQAPANTTVKVAQPDDPTDELVSRDIIDTGFTYVDATTNTSWFRVREVWSVSGVNEYVVQVNVANGVSCPAEGPVIVSDFNVISQPGSGVTGTEQFVEQYQNGNFLIKTYKRTYTLNIGASVQLVWTGTYQKAIYTPLNYSMPWRGYSYGVAVGGYTQDLGQTLTNNTTYDRKLWTQNITATLNSHTHQHAGTCIVWAIAEIPRESPSWLGNLLDGKYTRIQQAYGANFKDCISFKYENGVVLFINGNTNNPLVFAKNATLASQYNVPVMGSYAAWYSAEYHDGGWYPANINVTGDWDQWVYVADPNNSHTVMKANAFECGIGYECKAIPTHQSFTKNGNVGTISYSANNTSSTFTASITYW